MIHRVTTSGTASDNEQQQVITYDNEWLFRLIFLFLELKRNLPLGTLSRILRGGPIELRADLAKQAPKNKC